MIYPTDFEYKTGFDRIRELLNTSCQSELGRQEVTNMEFCSNPEILSVLLQETNEAKSILQMEDNFPLSHYYNPLPYLEKIKTEGTFIEVEEIKELRFSLETIKSIIRFFKDIKDNTYPRLKTLAGRFHYFPAISENIGRIIDKQGKIKDNASAKLSELRKEVKTRQSMVSKKIQSILLHARKEGLVDEDAEITIRDGRPVIPVIASNKRKLGGLVHDESASGKTTYIEPSEIVELNNKIKELEYAERREIIKILTDFSDTLRPYLTDLIESYLVLGKFDFTFAKARLAITLNANMPILENKYSFHWKNAIHPLLYISHKSLEKSVVPLTIYLTEKDRLLLISGPNAGGKSVCLKTVGLLQYMLQCGLLVPMSENSEVGMYEHIFIDIGDDQSLDNDLSTYSSHLLNMKYFTRHANEKTLLLIDEFGTGTEPQLGGAIAEAILEDLNEKKSFGVITTHYANLKHFANNTPGITNGAMLFDMNKIEPTYQLAVGKPGSSFAIDVARKIGLSEEILKNASEKIGEDKINFDKHLREIARDKRYIENKRTNIRKVEKTLENLYGKYSDELEDLIKQRKKIIAEAREEANDILKETNKRIEGTIRQIKESKADKEKTKALRAEFDKYKAGEKEKSSDTDSPFKKKMKEIKHAEKKLYEKNPELKKQIEVPKTENKPLQEGDLIRLSGYDTVGEIIEISGNNIIVAFGQLMTTVKMDKIERVSESEKKNTQRKSAGSYTNTLHERKLRFKPEIDIRGKRANEAIDLIRDFIDDAIMVASPQITILHGKGNGILRQLIRDYLRTVDVVKTFRDDHPDRGGAGITIVELDYSYD